MRELRGRGYRLAICTNNVREWEGRWRAKLPVDEIFDDVIDSAFVGTRKPEPQIYELTLARLGVGATQALLVDDIEVNCTAARELGIRAVWFRRHRAGDRGDRGGAGRLRPRGVTRLSCRCRAGPSNRAARHSAASSRQRSSDSQGSTVSNACSSPTPASNASSPRNPAAIFSASRRFSPSDGNTLTRNSLFGSGWPTSSDACQAASIERSCSSRSATALA